VDDGLRKFGHPARELGNRGDIEEVEGAGGKPYAFSGGRCLSATNRQGSAMFGFAEEVRAKGEGGWGFTFRTHHRRLPP